VQLGVNNPAFSWRMAQLLKVLGVRDETVELYTPPSTSVTSNMIL
jgi:hypothetical protein